MGSQATLFHIRGVRRAFTAALLTASVVLGSMEPPVDLPAIPPLPESRFPDPAAAEPFARQLIARVPAPALVSVLTSDPALVPRILRNLGTAVVTSDVTLRSSVERYVDDVTRSARGGSTEILTTLAVMDPLRFGEDPIFRTRVNERLPRRIAALPRPVAERVLDELTRSAALDYETGEAIASAAHLAPRASERRRIPFHPSSMLVPDDIANPIEASIFSLSSSFFTAGEVRALVEAVHAASPHRRILILGDKPIAAGLANVTLIDDHSRFFSPWPRDPFLVARSKSGGVILVNRPNAQSSRAEDQNMVRAIAAGLPDALDRRWKLRWTTAPLPFHNGQILPGRDTVWISMHSVEPRALEILGLDHVPVETFHDPAAMERYFDALRRAASELEHFYGRRVRFVHALSPAIIDDLTGGANFDLDSVLTILGDTALVGDITLGSAAARGAPAAEWATVRRAYLLRGERDAILASQNAPRTVALQKFLDRVAAEMTRDGFLVRRLPLLNVPTSLVAREDVPQDKDFLITWNNVVLEGHRAEGFGSLLTSIDDAVRGTFAASGFKLVLFPPLTHSIVLGGGYRCASNHIRPR